MIKCVKELLAAGRRPWVSRVLIRYGTARGALMAGGIACTGMFSVFVVPVIGVSMLMTIFGQYPTIRAAVVDSINSLLPGVIDTGNGGGPVSVEQLTLPSALNLGSVLAAGAFIYSVISLTGTLKIALRAMLGLVNPVMRPVVGQLANIAEFLVIVAGVLVIVMASAMMTTLSDSVGRSLGLPQSLTGTGAWVMMLLLSFLIDTGVLALLTTVCGIRPFRRDLLQGCTLGTFALGVLHRVETGMIGLVTCNPLPVSFAAIAVLTLWLHLTNRVVLFVVAWMVNPPLSRGVDYPDEIHAHERSNYVTLPVPATLVWPCQPITSSLEADLTAHSDYVPPVPIP